MLKGKALRPSLKGRKFTLNLSILSSPIPQFFLHWSLYKMGNLIFSNEMSAPRPPPPSQQQKREIMSLNIEHLQLKIESSSIRLQQFHSKCQNSVKVLEKFAFNDTSTFQIVCTFIYMKCFLGKDLYYDSGNAFHLSW